MLPVAASRQEQEQRSCDRGRRDGVAGGRGQPHRAELIVGMLGSHGVSAAVSADDAAGQYPQMQIEGVRVLVAPADEASARRLLAAADDTSPRPVSTRPLGDG
jgi:hypothetical protein